VNAGEWIALGSLGLALVGGIAAGVVHSNRTAYQFGRHSERLDQAERAISELRETEKQGQDQKTEIALLTQTVMAMKDQLLKFEHDLRNLLTGKVQPARRRQSGAD
jgi:hypothetical protein